MLKRIAGILPGEGVGEEVYFFPRPYPWLEGRHWGRSEGLVGEVNGLLEQSGRGKGRACCEVRRDAFGTGTGEVLGVFATRDVKKDEVVLVDKSKCWGRGNDGVGKKNGAWGARDWEGKGEWVDEDDEQLDGAHGGEGETFWKRDIRMLWKRTMKRLKKLGSNFREWWKGEERSYGERTAGMERHREDSPVQYDAYGFP